MMQHYTLEPSKKPETPKEPPKSGVLLIFEALQAVGYTVNLKPVNGAICRVIEAAA